VVGFAYGRMFLTGKSMVREERERERERERAADVFRYY
jgi:hypothetical protein